MLAIACSRRGPARVDTQSVTSNFPNLNSRQSCFFRVCSGDKVQLSQLLKDPLVKLHFRSNDLEGQLWQQRTEDRLRRALGQLHGLVARIKVRLDDVNGSAGGVDKCCRVEVLVQGSGPVAISATARSWQDSIEAVASRLRQQVAMQLHRTTLVEGRRLAPVTAGARMAPTFADTRSLRQLRLD